MHWSWQSLFKTQRGNISGTLPWWSFKFIRHIVAGKPVSKLLAFWEVYLISVLVCLSDFRKGTEDTKHIVLHLEIKQKRRKRLRAAFRHQINHCWCQLPLGLKRAVAQQCCLWTLKRQLPPVRLCYTLKLDPGDSLGMSLHSLLHE